MGSDRVIVAWSAAAILAVGLAFSFTLARRTVAGRPVVRWLLVIFLAGAIQQLVDYYTGGSWATYLIWILGPILLGALVAEYRFRAGRRNPRPSAQSH